MPKFNKSTTLLFLLISFNLLSQEFSSVWNTNNTETGSSANNQITIPTNPAYTTYNYDIDWGDSTTDTGVTGNIMHTYATPGVYTISISGVFPSIYFNDNNANDKLKIIEIISWGNIQWQTMENAFYGCENMNFDAINAPDLSQVTTLKNMFRGGTSFNGILNTWNISTITDISGIFADCNIFNRPLDNWTTNSITDMSETFKNSSFNQPLDNWNTASVTNMKEMLYACVNFNQNINNWNVSSVTDMSGMFVACRRFNQPLNNWNVSQVTDMNLMFFRTNDFNQNLSNWQVGNVTNMRRMFHESAISYPMNNWDVSKVTDMSQMFADTPNFNQPLNNWDVSAVTNMSQMFETARVFNQSLNDWDVSAVTNMSQMFASWTASYPVAFNQPLNNWDVSAVTNMSQMFANNQIFNQNLNDWDVSSVTQMQQMFSNADAFNQPLNNWDVSNVTNMQQMFQQNEGFNQPLNSWITTSLTNISSIFANNPIYNQPLNNWNISNVTNFNSAFNRATAFNQNLGDWNITSATNMSNMLSNSGISQENYDTILTDWSAQSVNSGITLGATNLQYCDALNQRQSLIDNHGWTISGDSVNCSYVLCTEITMPANGDTQVPANSDIRWAPAPNATGYKVTVTRDEGSGPVEVYNQTLGASNVGVDFTNEFNPGDEVSVLVIPFNDEGDAVGCSPITFTVVDSWVNSPDAFKLTYDTTILENGTTAANQLKIEANTGYPDYLTYDYSIDWGDGQYNNHVTNTITHTYLTPGVYTVSIIGTFPAPRHYYSNTDSIKLLSIDQWGTQVWQSMNMAFYGCENMEYNATDIPNLSQVESMYNMFSTCYLFNGNIDNWDVSNVTDMYGVFIAAREFNQPLNSWNVANVTTISAMFLGADAFDQPLNNWNTSNVTNMSRTFEQTDVFNQNINSWNVTNVTNMSGMFSRAQLFNQPLNSWNVSKVEDMKEMFYYAEAFNQDIDGWDVSNVIDMSSMFNAARLFNLPLNSWNVSKVNNMANMFSSANTFNQPLHNWNVTAVTNTSGMFSSATAFNQNIDSWNVTNVLTMRSMFNYALAFNQPLNNWDVNSVVNMNSTFRGASSFNQPLNNWDVSAVADMSSMFEDAILFNQPINNWNVSSVTLMESMFEDAAVFNQSLNNWDTAVVTTFEAMFKNALVFNEAISNWNTGEALTMEEMFSGAATFNQNIDLWDVSFVNTMQAMFNDARAYNQTMNSWNVASVTTMEDMFKGASAFNEDISNWNVRGVTTMEEMFSNAITFNQNINNWRVSGVSNMNFMFREASAYNQTMDLWNLGNVSMRSTFYNATSLDQYLGDWDVSGVTNMNDMLDNTALTRDNYDTTLISWAEQTVTSGITLGAQGLPYCDAVEERQSMIDNFGWTFDLDVRDCPIPECTQLSSPLNGDTNVPVNTNLTWDAAQFAQGYYLTVGTSPGGNDVVNNETITNETTYEFASDFNTGDTVYVTITPFNDEGNPGVCTEESFSLSNTLPTIPECTSLISPANGDSDVSVATDLSWNAISNADGYRLTIGTSTGSNDILNNEDVENVTSFNLVTDLPENSDIFITITPYNDIGDAFSCIEESFHTEIIPVPPTCTSLTSPAHQETGVSIDTHLSWTAIPEALGYIVIVGTTEGGNEIVNNVVVETLTSYDIPNDLLEGRTYYVTIIPYNNEGDATGCTEESFTTGDSTSPPSCAVLTSPANGSTEIAIDTNLSWNGSGSADGYRLTVGTTSGGTDIFSDDLGDVTTFDFVNDLPENETIYISIIAYNTNGDATGCTEYTFETAGPPGCSTLISPANNATDIAVDTSIEWSAVTDADGYKVTVLGSNSTANNMTNFEVTTGASFDFANDFTQGETVTVTIIPYNTNGDATGCTSESFTIVPPPVPLCTTLISPANNTTDIAINSDIEWNAVAGAEGYKLTVTGSESTANNLNELEITSGTSYDFLTDFEQGETVSVLIVPFNAQGDAIGCTAENFTIKPVPACTNLNAPNNGDTEISTNTSISWNAVTNAVGYSITVIASTSTINNLNNYQTTDTSYNFSSDFTQSETVSVSITPYNESGNSIVCATESFTIEAVPACTNLIAPLNGSIGVAINTGIEWTEISDAQGYRLTITGSSSTSNNVNNLNITSGNSYSFLNDFEQGETVTVNITPYNNAGDAIGCTAESFTIKSIPNCTTLIAPVDGAVLAEVNDITWNTITDANGYKLTITADHSTANNVTDLEVIGNSYSFPYQFNEGENVTVNITPFNEVGDAVGCASESFTIRPLPSCTNLISSLQNGNAVSVATDIEWNAAEDADGYRISIGTTLDGNDIVNNEDVASLTSYILNENLPSETLVFVKITPYNTSGDAVGCSSESFTTEVIAPNCTALTSPANGEIDVSLTSSIFWEVVEKTIGYRISIGTAIDSNDIVDNLDVGSLTAYSHSEEFPFDTEIYITITPYNSAGDAISCIAQSFTTMIPEDETEYGFSPDGDGINEYWHIENIDYYPKNVVSIYNRWGDMVFQVENYDNALNVFSGTANRRTKVGADQLPSGTYFFNIQIEGQTILRKTQGYLVLKR